jgi:starch-binding outer membrane protein, SusD/RagB family
MKKIIRNILLMISFILAGQSCSESFLEQEYGNGLVDANFFTDPSHAERALTAVYDVLGHEGQCILTRNLLGSSTADDVVEDHGDYSRVGTGMIELDKYNWHSNSRYIMDHWYSCYKGIGRANQITTNVADIDDLDQDLAARYIGEAKALRALFYFHLVTAYGDVPLLTEPITQEESKDLTRTPEAEIWDQIIKDLEEARDVLPDSYSSNSDLGRVTKGFANAMLSRVFLWTGDYAGAIDAAEAVIGSPFGYTLETNYSDIFDGTVENGKESILDVMNVSDSPIENIFRTETSEVNRSIYWGPVVSWSHFYTPATDFVDNEFEALDLRKDFTILDMGAGETYDINGDGVIDDTDKIPPNPPHDMHMMKYVPKGEDLSNGTWNTGLLQYVNVHVMRFAEVLLNYAEALNESEKPADALVPLNRVRERAGLALVTTTSQDELAEIILHERAVELCFEGHRFFDLKRAGKLNEVLSPLGFISGKHDLFPIPQTEIDLTKMSQNPNYN